MYSNWPPTTSCQSPLAYFPASPLIPQPDIVLEIGPPPTSSRFWAHSQIISQYSGYLRSAVSTVLAGQRPPLLYPNAEESPVKYDKPIFIPNLTVDQFHPLLRYMYSGFLELTVDNIFGVLLATHILHMPHALEICRSYLAQMQSQGIMATSPENIPPPVNHLSSGLKPLVVKPIPNKPFHLTVAGNISCPSAPHALAHSSCSTFQTLRIERNGDLSAPSSTALIQTEAQQPSPSAPCASKRGAHQDVDVTSIETTRKLPPEIPAQSKAIIDIACCDGPVRFRRVLNKCYGSPAGPLTTNHQPRCGAVNIKSYLPPRNQFTASSFHQQMAKDIKERRLCADMQTSPNSQDTNPTTPANHFKCVVCKHTFKSEYCYLKHSKRHLIPLTGEAPSRLDNVENSDHSDNCSSSLDYSEEEMRGKGHKSHGEVLIKEACQGNREVIRPLDMNVQYYPCKTCGSKFPSYYFVHKHRKLCHQQSDNENGSDPDQTTTASIPVPIDPVSSTSGNVTEARSPTAPEVKG